MSENQKPPNRMARLISNLLHPWVILALAVGLSAYKATTENGERVKWTLLTLLMAYFPAMVYASIRTILLSKARKNEVAKSSLLRERPRELLFVACLFGFPAVLTLHFLNVPRGILVVVIGAAVTMLALALANLTYRASFHVALLTSALFSLWILIGVVSLAAIPLVALVGLSRYQLGEHTVGQLITGFVLGLTMTASVLHGFGLVG